MPDISGEYAGHWWRRFWWIRGVIAALTLTSVVPNFTGISRLGFLKTFQLTILKWNEFMSWIGVYIGKIPFLPVLHEEDVRLLVLWLTFGPPFLIGWWRAFIERRTPVSPVVLGHEGEFFLRVFRALVMLVISLCFALICAYPHVLYAVLVDTGWNFSVTNIFLMTAIPWVVGSAILFFIKVPGFLRGLFYFATFCVTLQLLYVVNTPGLASWIDITHCELTADNPSICQHLETS